MNVSDIEDGGSGVFLSALSLVLSLFFMGLWGVLSIYNATAFTDSPLHYAGLQLLWLFIGFGVFWGASSLSFKFYERHAPIIFLFFYSALVFVLIFGGRINGMRGWYDLGFCLIQPSELSKPVFLFSLAWLFAPERDLTSSRRLVLMGVLTVLWCAPIAFQPDFGTLTVYLMGVLIVFLVSGGRFLLLLPGLFIGMLGTVPVFLAKPYVFDRVLAFLDPSADPTGAGWHILQFKYTLARGGFSGRDWGGAVWSNAYLPLSYSDSTFASLTESVGFVGAMPVIIGFCLLAYLCYRLSLFADGESRRIFVFSVGMLVAAQAFLHMSVNVGLFPPTGITLPMFSYGGSSLVSTMLGFGMVLSAARGRMSGNPAHAGPLHGNSATDLIRLVRRSLPQLRYERVGGEEEGGR